jgi:hypothetical protein
LPGITIRTYQISETGQQYAHTEIREHSGVTAEPFDMNRQAWPPCQCPQCA